jgi:hypothetical protein
MRGANSFAALWRLCILKTRSKFPGATIKGSHDTLISG